MTRNGFKVLDSDMHVMEPPDLWQTYTDPKFRDRAPEFRGVETSHGFTNKWIVEGKIFPALFRQKASGRRCYAGRHEAITDRFAKARAAKFDNVTQLEALEVEGIDIAVLFRTFGAHVIALDGLDPDLALSICAAFNDWLHDFCSADPSRLKGAAQMPMHDAEKATQEARRAVKELGMVALVLPSNPVNDRPWYDPYYDPFWQEAESLGVPVCFHGIQGAYQQHIGTRFLDSFVIAHAATHPMELMMDVGSMIGGGVLERFPTLKAGFLEGNCSWLPWWLWRLDEEWETFGPWERTKLQGPALRLFPTPELHLRGCGRIHGQKRHRHRRGRQYCPLHRLPPPRLQVPRRPGHVPGDGRRTRAFEKENTLGQLRQALRHINVLHKHTDIIDIKKGIHGRYQDQVANPRL